MKFPFQATIEALQNGFLIRCAKCTYTCLSIRYDSLIESIKEHHEYCHREVSNG